MNTYPISATQMGELAKIRPGSCDHVDVQVADFGQFFEDLAGTTIWPLAANPRHIVTTLEEQRRRATTIVRTYVRMPRIRGKRVLDFGCGTGLVASTMAAFGAAAVVGYDIKTYDEWAIDSVAQLTANWEQVVAQGPYDVVLLYDVLDHVQPVDGQLVDLEQHIQATGGESAINGIMQVLNLLRTVAPTAEYLVRCHPWLAKHGTHLYTTLNRAYAHLFLTPERIAALGGVATETLPLRFPLASYRQAFGRAGFRLENTEVTRNRPDVFFLHEHFTEKLLAAFYANTPMTAVNVPELLSFEFVDFVASPAHNG